MQCAQCQAENLDGLRFCEDCGARLETKCPHCGAEIRPGKKFCGSCGETLGASTTERTPAASPVPVPAPESYTPPHLAERILTSRAALEGERKQVTVLFADLKGSMELLADRDPEEARAILDPVLERMMEAVHRYEGTVNQVMGDGIMALFGAPLAHEDHAVRASYAALRMQEAVRQYAQEVQRTHGLPLHIRVGLNSGEVVVRSIGSDLRMDYTAVGQTTHLAARMEQMALPGSILLAPDTLQLAEGYIQVKALGPVQVRGLGEPVEVYELLGAGRARSRLQAIAARGLTKFVGRDAELETLRRTLEQAGAGHGQVVALVGEPGVGKSRLVWEFSHSHRTEGWLVLDTRSVSYGRATSYLPVIDLLKSYCGIDADDDPRRVREKLTGKLLTLDPALGSTLPALLSLLDVPVEDPTWQALDPPQRRLRTLDALKRLLLRESREQPLLLVVEDLHWIDSETQALLDGLVESLPTARLLLLVNYRPEYAHNWGSKTYYSQIRLDPLPTASAAELLAALLGSDASVEPLKRLLIAQTEGNPFFLEESVCTLVETGELTGERGAYRLAQPITRTQVPATVQAVLAARIDRLVPEDKRLLQAAAVIGKDVPYPLLRAIAQLPEDALRQALGRLQAAEFLYEASLFPDLEYTFKHALTHEVAHGSLLQGRRRALHLQSLAAMERLYPDRQTEQAERLAHHAVQGAVWDKAVEYLRLAGAKAASRSTYREAVSYFDQAIRALSQLPEGRATDETAIDLRLALRNVLHPLGELDRILACLREAEALAIGLDDQRRLGWVSVYLGSNLWQAGEPRRAIELGDRALASATAIGDVGLRIAANWTLGPAFSVVGDYPRAVQHFQQNLETLQGAALTQSHGLPFLPAVQARILLTAWCLAELGEFADAIAVAEEAIDLAERTDHPFSIGATYGNAGLFYLRKGDLKNAIAVLERGQAYCRDRPTLPGTVAIKRFLAYAYAQSGRKAEAIELIDQVAMAPVGGYRAFLSLFLSEGEVYLLTDRQDDAVAVGNRVLAAARTAGMRPSEAWALRLLGEIAATVEPEAEQAESHYHRALALADELSMRPLVAHCHLGLGTLYRKIGRDQEAQGELATAAEMYRAMDMPFWLARATTALANPDASPG
jgi:class 3 adenylate cyclase/tetratricopeptide (TPR) repeat protein